MTGMDGIELLQHLLGLDSSIIVILLTAHGSIESAKEALRRGAFDYLEKPYDKDALLETINRALAKLDAIDVEIISASPKMESVKRMILKVARSNSTVLIRGESGTGKELIARAIHNQSPRAQEMFQAVNCAAINENLLESELFGHEKGSFTGAHADKKGLFEIADRGSLFLDEIAELDVAMQAKLCAHCKSARFGVLVALMKLVSTCASLRRPIATCGRWWRMEDSETTYITGSTCSRWTCHLCGKDATTFLC